MTMSSSNVMFFKENVFQGASRVCEDNNNDKLYFGNKGT